LFKGRVREGLNIKQNDLLRQLQAKEPDCRAGPKSLPRISGRVPQRAFKTASCFNKNIVQSCINKSPHHFTLVYIYDMAFCLEELLDKRSIYKYFDFTPYKIFYSVLFLKSGTDVK
jgi:hypothetical protein